MLGLEVCTATSSVPILKLTCKVASLVQVPPPAELSPALDHHLNFFFPTKYHYVDEVGFELEVILLPLCPPGGTALSCHGVVHAVWL